MSVTYIRIELEDEPEDADPRWRPEEGPYGPKSLGDPPKSNPVWIWGLLKTRPRSTQELADELRTSRPVVAECLRALRRRGHTIERQSGRYHCDRLRSPAEAPPLRVEETPRGLRLAPPAGWARGKVIELE
jgi:biotin operon repressor